MGNVLDSKIVPLRKTCLPECICAIAKLLDESEKSGFLLVKWLPCKMQPFSAFQAVNFLTMKELFIADFVWQVQDWDF